MFNVQIKINHSADAAGARGGDPPVTPRQPDMTDADAIDAMTLHSSCMALRVNAETSQGFYCALNPYPGCMKNWDAGLPDC
jgi:hypothetical protein